MAKKTRTVFICQSCGHTEPRWLGKCPSCQSWNSLVEETPMDTPTNRLGKQDSAAKRLSEITIGEELRTSTGSVEFDRVLGGGLIRGALILVGGDPGIGKSTLLLQAMGHLAEQGERVLYLSAEESLSQVKLRAERLGIDADNLYLLAETHLEHLESAIARLQATVVVVDSVQTVGRADVQTAIGSVTQIRAVTHSLMEMAKSRNITTFVVGHVTKEGAIAGPKVMEHMVDTVLYFEGERGNPIRLLRAHKNRFGSAQEMGLFEMSHRGLEPVENPSEIFLRQRAEGPGGVVVTSMEGTRPILVEVQALAVPSVYSSPRRTTLGFDANRTSMICAVLEARAAVDLTGQDLFVNVAGGVRIQETGIDLGVALALASTTRRTAIESDLVCIGEIGLSGEVRSVPQLELRLQEAEKLGFKTAVVPAVDRDKLSITFSTLKLKWVSTLQAALGESGLA